MSSRNRTGEQSADGDVDDDGLDERATRWAGSVLRVALGALAACFIGCGGGADGADGGGSALEASELVGEWSGTTSSDRPVSLTVTPAGVSRFAISYAGPGCTGETEVTPGSAAKITGGAFVMALSLPAIPGVSSGSSLQIDGQFTSATDGAGTAEISNACGDFSESWSVVNTP